MTREKVSGIKRHIVVDTMGFPHAIAVTTADVTDRNGAIQMILLNLDNLPCVKKFLVDGGYKHSAAGITNWRCIASHHVPSVMHRDDFTPVNGGSLMRNEFDEISMHMEEKMGRPFFCCDAVLDTSSRQIAIFSGYAKEMMPVRWKAAYKRTYVHWTEKKYDELVFGMPQKFHYGDGMGTNPIKPSFFQGGLPFLIPTDSHFLPDLLTLTLPSPVFF